MTTDFDAFLREQFELWREGRQVSPDPPSLGSLDALTCEKFMQSLDPVMGRVRMGPDATFTFGADRSNQPKKSPYELFSADVAGNVVLHRRYIYLVAAQHDLVREFGWDGPRVRFYDGPFALVAYDTHQRPYLVAEARDTEKEVDDLLASLRPGAKATKRQARLLEGLLSSKPKLFWVRGPGIDTVYELMMDGGDLSLVALDGLPTWGQLGYP